MGPMMPMGLMGPPMGPMPDPYAWDMVAMQPPADHHGSSRAAARSALSRAQAAQAKWASGGKGGAGQAGGAEGSKRPKPPATSDPTFKNAQAEAKAAAEAALLQRQGGRLPAAVPSAVEEPIGPLTVDTARRYYGVIKAFNLGSGYGFILCPELQNLFRGADVFLNQPVDGGIVIGSAVSFTVEVSAAGKPQARNCRAEDGAKSDMKNSVEVWQHQIDKAHRGRVKSFNSTRGYGFLVCSDLLDLCAGHDIFVSKVQVVGELLTPGQEVIFRLQLDSKGQPQAHLVMPAPSEYADRTGFGPFAGTASAPSAVGAAAAIAGSAAAAAGAAGAASASSAAADAAAGAAA